MKVGKSLLLSSRVLGSVMFCSALFFGVGFCGNLLAADKDYIKPLSDIVEHPLRSAPATALSLNNTTLSAQIQANVKAIPVGVSQQVKQGDVLLQLDCTDYDLALQLAQAGVTMATAQLQLAKTQQDRTATLLKKNLTTQESVDTVNAEAISRQAQLDQAKISERQAQLDVSRCVIKAPFTGVVTARIANVGQLATMGTPLIAITDMQHLEVSAQVKPHEVEQLQQAELVFKADRDYPLKLQRVGSTINTETRDQEIRLLFVDSAPPPGTAGKLQWRDPRAYVPSRYVVRSNGQQGVMIAHQGKAEFHPLPDAIPGRSAVVDLPLDTLVVVKNLGQTKPGDSLP